MTSLLRLAGKVLRRSPAKPIVFPSVGYEVVPADVPLEEETLEPFGHGHYYPVHIGQIFSDQYQVLGKLGFGISSTVWLAKDLKWEHRPRSCNLDTDFRRAHRHVTLKIYTRESDNNDEFRILKRLSEANNKHKGYAHVRAAHDKFQINREGGDHFALVLKPTWESFKDLLLRNPSRRFTPALLKAGLMQIFQALDYLHNECHIVHTDIKADNILQSIEDPSILEAFTQAELKQPSPRKVIDEYTVYASRSLDLPKSFGNSVLSDFGSAVAGDEQHDHDIQPDVYRSPEVMLNMPWSYPADIWNVGVMVIYSILEHRFIEADAMQPTDLGPVRRQAYVLRV